MGRLGFAMLRLERMRTRSVIGLLGASALLVATVSCGSGGSEPSGATAGGWAERQPATASERAPERGGSLTFGLIAETTGGFCLPEAQYSGSGITASNAVFEPLVFPDSELEMQPYLAREFTVNDDATQFDFFLREGIEFHDGTPLDAAAVALNFDIWRGEPEAIGRSGRNPILLSIALEPIEDVEVLADDHVRVRTTVPWPAFPQYLASGRFSIAAPAQLLAEDCAERLIGTGPFRLERWERNVALELVANEAYWRIGEDGEPLPYLDRLTFVPVPSDTDRVDRLYGDTIQAGAFNPPQRETLSADADRFVVVDQREGYREVTFALFNVGRAAFADREVRRNLQRAVDQQLIIDAMVSTGWTAAFQPFDTEALGHVEEPATPAYDPEAASSYFADHPLALTITHSANPQSQMIANEIARQLRDVGVDSRTSPVDEATLINVMVAGEYDMLLSTGYPGADPDTQYVWWRSNSLLNFANFVDPELDALMDAGRSELDAERRAEIYRDVSDRFTSEAYHLWLWYAENNYIARRDVHQLGWVTLPDGSESIGMQWGWTHWGEVWVETAAE